MREINERKRWKKDVAVQKCVCKTVSKKEQVQKLVSKAPGVLYVLYAQIKNIRFNQTEDDIEYQNNGIKVVKLWD